MSTRQWIVLTVVLTALVLLMIPVVRAGLPVQEPELQGITVAQAGVGTSASTALSTSFTYQGQLESSGGPVNDDCDMAFRLYDQESGGSQVGSTITTTVPVSDGLFTVNLDFGDVFTGGGRWLALVVRCPAGVGDYDTLSPRQPLSPVPYAMHATTVKQLVHDFVVAGGESVSAGDVVWFLNGQVGSSSYGWGPASTFNLAGTSDIAVSVLSATDFVIAYQDEGNSNYGTAIVGTVSGGSVSWGAESVFNEASTSFIAISALSANDFVVAYRDAGNSYYGMVRVGTVGSENTLSWGWEWSFNDASTRYIAVTRLSALDFVVAYADGGNSDYGTARVGMIDEGGYVFLGGESVFKEISTYPIVVSALSADKVVVAYLEQGKGTIKLGTVSGNTLNWGVEGLFNLPYGDTSDIAVSALSATDFVVAYRDLDNSGHGEARMCTVGIGDIMYWLCGEESVFNAASTYDIAISALSATDFVVAYRDAGNSGYGTAIVGTASKRALSWGPELVFNTASTPGTAVGALSATDFVVAYRHGGFYNFGSARVGSRRQWIGTAKSAAGSGETVTVILSGVSDVHSGLVPGKTYYLQLDGSLGLTPTDYRVGLAISESELLLDQMW